ncbi:PAS domain-containing protein [Phenylobacterium sp.]|uniref:sensor histidine kinase n=1 Tax=Phenylobacterium sp. TaxID=1871053 RepID=UPI002811B631|nr:PAS domain-containing protein [Phenylobacterium sp.]
MADLLHLGMAFQVVTDAAGLGRRFTYVGGLCREMTGLSPEEVIARPERLYGQIEPDHQEVLARTEATAIALLSRFDIEVRMRDAAGDVRWRRITSTPRPQPDGTIVWNGLLMDITDAKRAAESLEDQRRRLEAAVEATGLGFWEWDVRNDRVVWSDRNCELFGVPAGQSMTIERYQTLVHPEDQALVREVYRGTRERGGDFFVEHRTAYQPDAQPRWLQARGRVVKDAEGVRLVVGTTLDVSERKATEERRALLLGELAHRAKNGIQVMIGIVMQTSRSVGSVKEFEQVLIARLKAMADSQDLVTASGGRPVLLRDVVTKTLTPFDPNRFELDEGLGEAAIAGDVAVALALLLHELSTNAVKYGALSTSNGRVALHRSGGSEGHLRLDWIERGGPPVAPARRKGFGSRLLDVGLAGCGGRVEPAFDPDGFKAKIHFPVADEASRMTIS